MRDWAVWQLDVWTWGWIGWIAFFAIWESLTGIFDAKEMLTWHLRPVLGGAPIAWFVAFGLWVWVGVHLLAPTLEAWIIRSTG